MWVDYDKEADVLYVSFRKPQRANKTLELDDDILVRKDGREIVGITILNASLGKGRALNVAADCIAALSNDERHEALLNRGLCLPSDTAMPFRKDAATLAVGDSLTLRLARGAADVRVQALPTGNSTDDGKG